MITTKNILAVLYTYPLLEPEIYKLNKRIERKIKTSNLSAKCDAWERCMDVLDLMERKNKLLFIKAKIDKVLWSFGDGTYKSQWGSLMYYFETAFLKRKEKRRCVDNKLPYILWMPAVTDFAERLSWFGFSDESLKKDYFFYDIFKHGLYEAETHKFEKIVNVNRVFK